MGVWVNENEIIKNNNDDDNNGYVDDINGWDFINNINIIQDKHGHGTHCAGSIAAIANNELGVVGVCQSARVMTLKILDDNGKGRVSAAISAINYAIHMGASIINTSWGGTSNLKSMRTAAVAAAKADVLMVVSAGNSGLDSSVRPYYPAAFNLPNILSVASSDNTSSLARHSNFGTSVDVCAPGLKLASLWKDGEYSVESGTSMAAPLVAGTAALLKSLAPTLTASALRGIIMDTARKSPSLNNKVVSAGVIDVRAAVSRVLMEYPNIRLHTHTHTHTYDSN
eukprot:GHVR01029868.1.p1 GENE.GHVR01029868.1~~GHVR01029868.1.p1  ORF type:complete len:283 (-),score=102.64 GHVR01029868.1:900-1748(-)